MIRFNSILPFQTFLCQEVTITNIKLLNQRESQAVRRWERQEA